ncbi:zinc finger protein [Elysia marginata]|uniref:Zinc finger protein n=1 Tax=Elysia marginata TaxID=1093978 RepID=A0AAV4FEY0_9GAST|nr:zinc finger protein [Elysia marginata]
MSVKFQFSKLIMEKFLRRSFYDAVLRLYETAHGARIISVSLEGHLSLVVNKNENFVIKLNEIAQRADDGEDPHQNRIAKFINFKPDENAEEYFIKQEDDSQAVPSVQTSINRNEVIVNLDDHMKEDKKITANVKVTAGEAQYVITNQRLDYVPVTPQEATSLNLKTNQQRESITYKQSDSSELTDSQQTHPIDHSAIIQDGRTGQEDNVLKTEPSDSTAEEICFLPVAQVEGDKRKLEFDYQGHAGVGKRSPHKRRKLSSFPELAEEGTLPVKSEDKEKEGTPATESSDVNANSLQLLPHTAIAPIVVEDEDSNYGPGMEAVTTQGQIQQQQPLGTMFQLRDQVRPTGVTCAAGMGMFRQQDLEELARQQQQWQMVAYQRSIMEKSYFQQQLLRDSERLRWEFTSQQPRDERVTPQADLPSQQSPGPREFAPVVSSTPVVDAETAEKLYRQAQANTEAALLAAAALEQVKKNAQEGQVVVEQAGSGDKLSTPHYIRILEEHSTNANAVSQAETEYEEGELRHDTHICVLCGIKFMALEPLIRHMEKHRVAFERSCSVCQSGTLTGNMLKLHMEASHGPETSFPMPSMPSMAVAVPPVITSSSGPLTSSAPELSQSFHAVLQGGYPSSLQLDLTNLKLPQQAGTSLKQVAESFSKDQEGMMTEMSNSNPEKSEEPYEYHDEENTHLPSRPDDEGSSSNPGASQQEQESTYIGLTSAQFYPLIACQVCGEKFALSEALDQHVESQHKDAESCTYTCKPCALSFDSHVEYSKHTSHHESSLQTTSLSSSTSTSSAAAVAAAVASSSASSAAQLKCSHCLKAFKSVKQLRLHYVAAHGCCHFCEYCRAGFPDAMSLQLHEQLHTLDPEKLSFRCDICSKAFYTQSQCSAHKRTHKDEKAHACEVCGSSFFKRGDLTKHVRTVHSPSRLFACKFCGKKGTRMDNMRSHVRSHHKSMTRDQIVNMIEVIE